MTDYSSRLVSFRTISVETASLMQAYAEQAAKELGVPGFIVVCSATGMQLCSRAVGLNARSSSVQIALAKIEIVLFRRQSTSVWRDRIIETSTRPENYAGGVKTLFGGGLAIFADGQWQEFVGAIAFSGGEEWQDQLICLRAIDAVGLCTDDIV